MSTQQEKTPELVTVFGLFEPDNHYAYPALEILKEFKLPHSVKYLIERYTEADCSGPNMVGAMSDAEIRDMFFEYAYYELYKGSFILIGTNKAIEELKMLQIEPDWNAEGNSQFPLGVLADQIELTQIEGLDTVIFINPETGIFTTLKGEKEYGEDITKKIADFILSSKSTASIISVIRNNNPDNPILKEIEARTNSDVVNTLGSLGDLGF